MVLVIKENTTIATVPKWSTCRMNTNALDMFDTVLEEDRVIVAKLCWQLASTPLKDREEPTKYYLRIVEPYMSFFDEGYLYLNMNKQTRKAIIDSKGESVMFKTTFTIDEIEALEQEHDLSLFEKVEVE